jgi:hypothetical protein
MSPEQVSQILNEHKNEVLDQLGFGPQFNGVRMRRCPFHRDRREHLLSAGSGARAYPHNLACELEELEQKDLLDVFMADTGMVDRMAAAEALWERLRTSIAG